MTTDAQRIRTPDTGDSVAATATQVPVLEICNLSRNFGRLKAVDDISFRAEKGQVIGFIGPNGAGKTTTMRILATLDQPDDGDAFICGHSVIDFPDYVRKFLGYMPDSFGKYANMNVADYLDFFARAYGLRGRARHDAIRRVMDFTELDKLQFKPVKSLSKGMSQRLGLGRTLIHDPQLLILDEPAAGLDPRARVELRELVHLLAHELDKTVLISSHILTELGEICDSVLIIEAGRILVSGNVADIHEKQRQMRDEGDVAVLQLKTVDRADIEARETLQRWLLEQPFVAHCDHSAGGLTIGFSGNALQQHELLKRMLGEGFPVLEYYARVDTLEDAFMTITRGETR